MVYTFWLVYIYLYIDGQIEEKLTGYLQSRLARTEAASSPHMISFKTTFSCSAYNKFIRFVIVLILANIISNNNHETYLFRSKNRSAHHRRKYWCRKVLTSITNFHKSSTIIAHYTWHLGQTASDDSSHVYRSHN